MKIKKNAKPSPMPLFGIDGDLYAITDSSGYRLFTVIPRKAVSTECGTFRLAVENLPDGGFRLCCLQTDKRRVLRVVEISALWRDDTLDVEV